MYSGEAGVRFAYECALRAEADWHEILLLQCILQPTGGSESDKVFRG